MVSIAGSLLTVRLYGTNRSVALAPSTSFYRAGGIAKQSDLLVGDVVSVAGAPDDNGVIQAVSVTIR